MTDSNKLPVSIDWRNTNPSVVSPVKDQGTCGCCWAFSALGSLESAYAIANGVLVDLSEQNLNDCVYGEDGCMGGWMSDAWTYIQAKNGIDTESAYPYDLF